MVAILILVFVTSTITSGMGEGHPVADCYTTRKDSSNDKDLCQVSLVTYTCTTHTIITSADHMTMNCVVHESHAGHAGHADIGTTHMLKSFLLKHFHIGLCRS